MSTYGDRGNIIVLQKRCEWRGIGVHIDCHGIDSPVSQITRADVLFMGGAQDRQQDMVSKDIAGKKTEEIRHKIEKGTPGLFICGAYQFLGKYYKAADGTKISGLGIFDLYTEHSGDQEERLIGNIVVKPELLAHRNMRYVGFENHGGRTYLGNGVKPFARVIRGFGNNGEDGFEGAVYNNAIGSYFHGPLLPKNPFIADWLLEKVVGPLKPLDDSLEQKANEAVR
ncbi:MAG: CobB/CobQ domain protein glutamine amidotransferase [Candidatus Roizmanbacteria bacterium GW2011_GWB1_40_7]|uniref:Lipid II isoglutaminyl synthase (glutamine-hydrolyzing) subunit GatD n=1 Tax=Candidatus Roizmanbacteria bacterium GW2011_GWB1_40_7 TaxID=1618482 RepID=A0A0G0WAI3_9BACT|nr:MAG: CobB/CobQ domain protein glutamine amidotransferase [Candidatus Roizmanbacteria bacterium GW2011_GWB1_40_7]